MKIKNALFTLCLIILSATLVFCSAQENVKVPTERDVLSGGYWYSEDSSVCFVFDAKTDDVMVYSLNSGSNTYNFGNVLSGKYSLEECTLTFGVDVRYYVLDGNVMTIGEDKLTLDTQNAPSLNTAPMESAAVISLETPVPLIPSNPGINEKIYLKFTPEKDGKYFFDFAISDVSSKQSDATYIWILDPEFREVIQGNDDINVFLSRSKTYYIIATVSAISSDTGTNTLTVTNVS